MHQFKGGSREVIVTSSVLSCEAAKVIFALYFMAKEGSLGRMYKEWTLVGALTASGLPAAIYALQNSLLQISHGVSFVQVVFFEARNFLVPCELRSEMCNLVFSSTFNRVLFGLVYFTCCFSAFKKMLISCSAVCLDL
ncbi:hypothetical protein P8452_22009 [Trifolium repens]|nr:hypothetical protein P8452_22009 [Trifolium repens]